MIRTLLTTTAALALLSTGALAQNATPVTPAPMAPAPSAPAAMAPAVPASPEINSILATGYTVADTDALATTIIGRGVYSSTAADAERIGDVNNLVLGDNGEINAVVIGVGGFLGIGEKNVAVNFSELQLSIAADGSKRYVLPTTKDALQSAPDFKTVDNADATNVGAITTTPAPATNPMPAPVDNNMAATTPAPAIVPATPAPVDNTQVAANNPSVAPADTLPFDRSTLKPVTLTTDQLTGTEAYGPNNEHLGKISDVVLADDGKTVDAVIIDFGGFLGIGAKPVAVAFDNLQFSADQNNVNYVFLNVTRDQLQAATAFDKNTFKDQRDTQLLKTASAG